MATIYELKKRAKELAAVSETNTVDPARVGNLIDDTLELIDEYDKNVVSLGIRKTYATVAAMEADKSPSGDDGKKLRFGQLVSVYDIGNAAAVDNGKVFAWQNPGWKLSSRVDAGYARSEKVAELVIQRKNSFDYDTLLRDYRIQNLPFDTWSWESANINGVTPEIGNSPIWKTSTDGFITIPLTGKIFADGAKYFGGIFECLGLKNVANFNPPDLFLSVNNSYRPFKKIRALKVGNRFMYMGYIDITTLNVDDTILLILSIHAKDRTNPDTLPIVAEFSALKLFYIDSDTVDGMFTLGDVVSSIASENLPSRIDILEKEKVNVVPGNNRLDPSRFRYGYFYYSGQISVLSYNENMKYGCTDYIQVSENGLVSFNTGRSAQGMSGIAVFNKNKDWLRNLQNTDQYTYQPGDGFAVFVYFTNGNLRFADNVAVVEGVEYDFEIYTQLLPIANLDKRVSCLEKAVCAIDVINGSPIIYGDISNYFGPSIIERNIKDNYLIYKKTGLGTEWICSPIFTPKCSGLVHVKFNVGFKKVETTKALDIWIAENTSVSTGKYINYATVANDGVVDITFDPAYFTVYKGYTQFCVWICNQNMNSADQSITAKISNLQIVEYENSINATNIGGENVKELFESTDQQLTDLKNKAVTDIVLTSLNGSKFEVCISNEGAIYAIPIIPTKAAFFGNSLISGFGYGMAASQNDKDYYYLITEFLKTINPAFTSSRLVAGGFEALTDPVAIDSTIQKDVISKLTGDETLISVQLGDNVNTPEKNAVFPESSLKLLQAIRVKCPNARVVWQGMWYASVNRYEAIQNACAATGSRFVSYSGLPNTNTQNKIGNLTKKGVATRMLSGVVNVVTNSETNITITFVINSNTYLSTIDVTSYSLNNTTQVLTYTGEYEIISSGGVASHPNDNGFRLISNRFLYEMGYTEDKEYYK